MEALQLDVMEASHFTPRARSFRQQTTRLPDKALRFLEDKSGISPSVDWSLNLKELPPGVAANLRHFDKDGDGTVSLEEIMLHGAELEHERMMVRSPVATAVRA